MPESFDDPLGFSVVYTKVSAEPHKLNAQILESSTFVIHWWEVSRKATRERLQRLILLHLNQWDAVAQSSTFRSATGTQNMAYLWND